jgi:hypothetical protein
MTLRKARITFCKDVTVRVYDASVNVAVKHELWYSSREMQDRWWRDARILDHVRQCDGGESSTPVEESIDVTEGPSSTTKALSSWDTRGLESRLDGGVTKARNRMAAVLSVIIEQDRQHMEGTGSDLDIALRYQSATRRAREEAHCRALADFAAAHSHVERARHRPLPTLRSVMSRAA